MTSPSSVLVEMRARLAAVKARVKRHDPASVQRTAEAWRVLQLIRAHGDKKAALMLADELLELYRHLEAR